MVGWFIFTIWNMILFGSHDFWAIDIFSAQRTNGFRPILFGSTRITWLLLWTEARPHQGLASSKDASVGKQLGFLVGCTYKWPHWHCNCRFIGYSNMLMWEPGARRLRSGWDCDECKQGPTHLRCPSSGFWLSTVTLEGKHKNTQHIGPTDIWS